MIVNSSIGPTIAFMTSRRQIQDGGPHDTKMAAPTTSGPRWRPPRHQDGGPHDFQSKMAAPTTPRWRPHFVRSKMAAPTTSDPRWRPHDFRSKMAAPTTSDPRWRPPRLQIQDGGPQGVRYKMAVPCDAFGYTSEGESTP